MFLFKENIKFAVNCEISEHIFLLVKYKVWKETTHCFFFSESIVTIIMKFIFIYLSLSLSPYIYIYIYIYHGCILYKIENYFHKVSFNINLFFPNSRETFYAGRVKLSDEASELFKHTVFQLVVSAKRSPPSSSFMGPRRWKSEGAKSGL